MPASLKILMICPQFRPIVGGYERAAERLSVALASKGHVVTIITEHRDFSWQANEELDGVQIKRLWCLYRVHLHMITSLASFALFLLTQGRRFQIWHIHEYGLHAVLVVAIGKLLGRPAVIKLTSSKEQGLHLATAALPMAGLVQALLRKLATVIATTRETQVEAEAFGIDASRVHVLGNGIDIRGFRPHSDEEQAHLQLKLNIDARGVVLFVGRLSSEKNPDGLLIAWKIARTNLPEGWKLVLVGDGPMRGDLESLAETKGTKATVIFVGQQTNVETWMAAADIFVVSSHREGLSNTMLEAMSTGLPVVSTRVSGSVEVLKETGAGLVVGVGQMDQLSDALNHLASDPLLRNRMGKIGRAVIEKNYSIERIAELHEQLYRRMVGRE